MNSYLKLCTEFYDIDKPTAPADALAYYMRLAREANGPILEPMCGSGRFLVPMIQAGLDVDGSDASPQMLGACRDKCRELGLKVNLQQQFLQNLDMPRHYKLLFIPSGSFQLVTDMKDVRESLRRIHNLLLPGGKLVIESEIHKPDKSSSWPWGGRWTQRPDGARIIISWLGHYDAGQSISFNIHKYELIKNGQLLATEFSEFNLRSYDASELESLLRAAGFQAIKMFKPFDPAAPPVIGEDAVIECTRS